MEKPPRNPNVAPPPYSQSFVPLPPQRQIITTTVVVQSYGPEPMDIQCPYCASHIRTRLDFKIGALTWILCIFLGILVCLCDCTKVNLRIENLGFIILGCGAFLSTMLQVPGDL